MVLICVIICHFGFQELISLFKPQKMWQINLEPSMFFARQKDALLLSVLLLYKVSFLREQSYVQSQWTNTRWFKYDRD